MPVTPVTPVLTGLSIDSGPSAGGNAVTITGSGFYPATEVLIGGVAIAPSQVAYISDTKINVTMPAHARGTVQVSLRSGTVTSGTTATYTYTNSAPVAVDDEYTFTQGETLSVDAPGLWGNDSDIDGDSFTFDAFGSPFGPVGEWPDALNFFASLSNNDGSFGVTPPAEFFGIATFQYVIADVLEPSNVARVTFRVEPTIPIIDSVSEVAGPLAGGTQVTISGKNFLGATAVTFGGVDAISHTVLDDTTITATAPAGAVRGPVAVGVHKVDAAAGMEEHGELPDGFTYLAPGTLSVTPAEDFEASGPPNGPFADNGVTWVLENTGDEPITVQVWDADDFYFAIIGAAEGVPFVLTPRSTHEIGIRVIYPGVVSPDHYASSITRTVSFDNLTNGRGSTTRDAILKEELYLTSLALTAAPPAIAIGETTEVTARVSSVVPAVGQVEFFLDGSVSLGTVPVSDNTATLDLTDLTLGSSAITARYFGSGSLNEDSNGNAESIAPQIIVNVLPATPSIDLSSSHNPSLIGDTVSFEAKVTGGLSPAGDVEFFSGTASLGTVALSAGSATLDISDFGVGSHEITAVYLGDTNNSGVTSDELTQQVGRYMTGIDLSSSHNPSLIGDMVSFKATVSGGLSPTGSVEFFSGTASLGVEPLSAGGATLDISDLAVGDHEITAVYSGDANNSGVTSDALTQEVGRHTTSINLVSSHNPSLVGDAVSFKATMTGGLSPMGSVEFLSGTDSLGVEPLLAGIATLDISDLAVGDHQITAVYSGDASNLGVTSAALSQRVEAMPQIVLRVETDGHEGPFAFSSAQAALNLSIAAPGGSGQSAPISLMPGSHGLTMADRRADGLLLTDIACSDSDSTGDVPSRTLQINLDPAEVLVCTFTLADTAQQTLQEIASFLEARANVLLANMPDAQRRFARLKGGAGSVASPGSVLMSYLPVLANGGTLSGSASLAQIEALAGHEEQARLDAWIEGTFGLYGHKGAEGRFGLVAFGADYLLSEDLLVGGFVQIDQLSQETAATAAASGGTGWLAGPYLTARLSENLYLDIMAAGGQAENRVSPLGTYEDWYGSTRFLANATLQGDWSYGAWTFAPAASATWFSETSSAYTDSLGVLIPSTSVEQGQFTAGPGVRHSQDLGNGTTLSSSLRFDAVASWRNSMLTPDEGDVHGRISAGLDLGFAGGAALGVSLTHDGLFGASTRATALNLRLSAPLR